MLKYNYAHHRNEALKQAGIKFPTPLKTGTTIAGIVYKVLKHHAIEPHNIPALYNTNPPLAGWGGVGSRHTCHRGIDSS